MSACATARILAYTVTRMETEEPLQQRTGREPWTADRVARLRTALGLTQASFAEALGVRQQTVSEWETGRYQPRGASVRVLQMLAEGRFVYDQGGEAPPPEPPRGGGRAP